MPKFNKSEKELTTRFEKWMFVLKNLPKLERIPVELKGQIFLKLFETAEIAKLKPEEYKQYEASMNAYRDVKNSIDTAFEKGEIKGIEKGKIEVAENLLKSKIDVNIIVKSTGLTKDEIEALKDE